MSNTVQNGAGGKQVSFVASGTLSSGQTAALNSDGTVSAVENVSAGFGASANWDTAAPSQDTRGFPIALLNPFTVATQTFTTSLSISAVV